MHNIIVTLTTIDSRLKNIHLVIESLLKQDFPIDNYKVHLYLSENPYLLDKGCPKLTTEIQRLVENNKSRFIVKYVENFGPHRKILPVLSDVYKLSTSMFCNTLIVTADDDTIYPEFWLKKMFDSFLVHQCVIGYRGRQISFSDERPSQYKKWEKKIKHNPSLLNVPIGKDGVLYSPLHLHPSVLKYEYAFRFAPKTDDLWLKTHALLIKVPSFIINTEPGNELPSLQCSEPNKTLYDVYNMSGGNDESVNNIENYLKKQFLTNIHQLCNVDIEGISNRKIYLDYLS